MKKWFVRFTLVAILCLFVASGIYFYNLVFQGMDVTEPEELNALAQTISSFQMPEGFIVQKGATSFWKKNVQIGPADYSRGPIFILVQLHSDWTDPDFSIKGFDKGFVVGLHDITFNQEQKENLTINGKNITFTHATGLNTGGNQYEKLLGLYQGEKYSLLILAFSDYREWDKDFVHDFISTLNPIEN